MAKNGTAKAKATAPQWPGAKEWPLARVIPYENNERTHPPDQIQLLANLLLKFGPDQPIVVDEHGVILKGHGRREAALSAGMTKFPVVQRRGLSDHDKTALRISDNQSGLLAGWNHALVQTGLKTLETAGYDLNLLGFSQVELTGFRSELVNEIEEEKQRGALLELVNITIAEPRHQVERGDHYVLGDRHHLLCQSVISGWPTWAPLLKDDALFCPYPGVFVPFGNKAKTHVLVLVQGDPYIAGHILDRWVEANGKKSVRKMVTA